jgi:putative copper resistance protein D
VYVQGIANFIDDLLGGAGLVALSLVNGSLLWWIAVLRAGRAGVPGSAAGLCACWLRRGAVGVTLIQALKLVVKAVLLSSSLGDLPWSAYFGTTQFLAGTARVLLGLVVVYLAQQLVARPSARQLWWSTALVAAAMLAAGAWLVHGVGRLENRGPLMVGTAIHQLMAGVWVGGVMQLLVLWRAGRKSPELREFFPAAVARFSPLGMTAVAVLVGTGLGLATVYVASWSGVFGTAYGSLVAAKSALLLLILIFAALNFTAGRNWLRNRVPGTVLTRVPTYVEIEMLLLVAVLFVAATVSSQPPAVDIPDRYARAHEVLEMFAPRVPALKSPSLEDLIAGEAGRLAVVDRRPSAAATQWSDFNHNVAGIVLVAMALVAYLSYLPGARMARWWPLGFLVLSVFLFFRSDAETWPTGPIGFWESTFGNGEVLQHRLATLLAFSIGVVELRARIVRSLWGWTAFLFPALAAVGGVLLLTHAHLAFEIKSDYLIQSTHLVLGLLAVVIAGGRWLELRFATIGNLTVSRAAGLVSVTAMLMSGYILVVYHEPLY